MSRRWKLFGLKKTLKSASTGIIYARRFDGINDEIVLSSSVIYSGDYWINYKLANVDVNAGVVSGSGTNRNIQFQSTSIQTRLADGLTVDSPFTLFPSLIFPITDHIFDTKIERVGSTLTHSINGESNSNSCTLVDTGILAIGSRNGSVFFTGDIVEITDSMGNIWNEENNWGGGTKSGTTLIQSTDGGVTWTITPIIALIFSFVENSQYIPLMF